MSESRTEGTPRYPRGNGRALLSLLLGGQSIRSAPSGGQLYMLLDTARDPRVYARLIELGDAVRARSLYQGDIGESFAHVSPYLLSLQDDKPESRWFAEAGFGQSGLSGELSFCVVGAMELLIIKAMVRAKILFAISTFVLWNKRKLDVRVKSRTYGTTHFHSVLNK
jgi:hypothetical protein